MADSNSPSQMIRVPTPLIDSVRQLSQLHRKGHTRSLLHKLQQLISDIDSSSDSNDSSNDIVSDRHVDSESIAAMISSQVEPLKADITHLIAGMISEQLAPIRTELGRINAVMGEC